MSAERSPSSSRGAWMADRRRRRSSGGPTLAQVAMEAGVSLTTASRAMNGGARGVNEAAQRQVLAAADRLGYVPNGHAASVASGGSSRTVGLVLPPLRMEQRAGVLWGCLRAAADAGFLLTIAESSAEPGSEIAAIRALRRQRVGVLIMLPSTQPAGGDRRLDAELAAFERSGASPACWSRPRPARPWSAPSAISPPARWRRWARVRRRETCSGASRDDAPAALDARRPRPPPPACGGRCRA